MTLEERSALRVAVAAGSDYWEAGEAADVSWRSVVRVMADAGRVPDQRRYVKSSLRLSLEERESISRGLVRGESFRSIAASLHRSPSTVSREVQANGGPDVYRAYVAEQRAVEQARRPRVCRFERCARLRAFVEQHLELRWSPRQIAARLAREFPDDPEMRVSHETIYQSLFVQGRGALRKELTACLRSGRARRRPQSRAATAQRRRFDAMVLISERPAEIEDRAVPGHWEGDLLMGSTVSRSAVSTLVERTSRFLLLSQLGRDHTAEHVADRLAATISRLPAELRRSLTWDQGSEMAAHQRFTIATGVQVYFCDPRSPWQRGTNENTNGLLRQFLPKGTDLAVYTQDDLDHIAALLNGRPRQTLGWNTPAEVINELLR